MNKLLIGIVAAIALSASAMAADNRPNIILIVADDHGRQATGCYGGKLIQTPNIDRLAHNGMKFTHAFANNSICSPSRAVLLTGKYNHLCGVKKLGQSFDGSQQTFPKLLQQAGYRTAYIGKWHLATQPAGFDYYRVTPTMAHINPPVTSEAMPWKGEGGGKITPGHATDLFTDLSLECLGQQKDKPVCLMLHYTAPHSPHYPAPREKDLFKDTVFPEPPNLLDDYAGRAPKEVENRILWSRLVINNNPEHQVFKKQYTGDRAHDTRLMYQEYVRGYVRMVAGIDRNVGQLLDYLDKTGMANNTIVIYTSDNGFFLGEHGFYNKMWMYEESLHLPLLVHLPGMTKAETCDRFVSMMDLAPTILDLAGVNVPPDIQGVSMMPLLMNQTTAWRDSFYYHFYGFGAETEWFCAHEMLGVRTTTGKLVYYPTWKNGPFWEYFDLIQDPLEMKNIYHDPKRQPEVIALKSKLRELAAHYKDTDGLRCLERKQ